jgi:hypothetical protein
MRCLLAIYSLLVVCIVGIFSVRTVHAHPFHLCVGQMQWNGASKAWEVSLRLHPQDLENAMSVSKDSNQPSQRVSIDDDGFSDLAIAYINKEFFLRKTPKAMDSKELDAILRSESKETADSAANADTAKSNQSELRSTSRWVGMEQERGWLWLHFEMTEPEYDERVEKLWLVHRVLLEQVEKQENTIAILPLGSPKFSLQFQPGNTFREFRRAEK